MHEGLWTTSIRGCLEGLVVGFGLEVRRLEGRFKDS